jgi:acyl-CoA synthetase (AMP-forming)/AMP-acid ligase II
VKKGLAHCISVSGAKGVVYGQELATALQEADLPAENTSKLWSSTFMEAELPKYSNTIGATRLKERRSKQGFNTYWGYIYTSGTTGLPKAANILHFKMFSFGGGVSLAFGVHQNDIVYTCLPLFHSAGGGLGAGMMLMTGCTMVLRKKFSAKTFWLDCKKYNVTVVQYIGELCRYLLASQANDKVDKGHKVRIAIGNGLRPEIWAEFKKRFNLAEIGEFYGSTEGNGALFNHSLTDEGIGAVGRLGYLLKRMTGMKLAKFDVERDELLRDKTTGRCVEAEAGQPGELLMPVKANDPSTTFAGYSDAKATEKKLVRNAFEQGDCYFSTGDLLSRDTKGYYRFVDRIGDTFRWKGENCSTTEVTEVVSVFPGVEEANVYGVLIPNNQDGRAPCAAITVVDGEKGNKLDLKGLLAHVKKNLPSYAVPLFIRLTPAIAVTATMKHQKGELRSEGIDISKVKDPLFYLNGQEGYVPLTPQVYAKITTPGARL